MSFLREFRVGVYVRYNVGLNLNAVIDLLTRDVWQKIWSCSAHSNGPGLHAGNMGSGRNRLKIL